MPSSRRRVPRSKKLRKKATITRKNKRVLIGLVLVAIMATGLALFYSGQLSINPTSPNIIEITVNIPLGAGDNPRIGFSPAVVTIVIGVNNTVVWKNDDSDWHTAHSNIPEFYSGIIQPGASFTHTFERPGTYPYHCDPHPWMTGVITVESPSSAPGILSQWRLTLTPSSFQILLATSLVSFTQKIY